MKNAIPQIRLEIGGTSFSLNRDGTMDVSGSRDRGEMFAALDFFKPPAAGREWWPRLLVHHIQTALGEEAANDAAKQLFGSSTRRANAQNATFVKWCIEQGLPGRASVEAVDSAKSLLWDRNINAFRGTDEARFVLHLLLEGRSWEYIRSKVS